MNATNAQAPAPTAVRRAVPDWVAEHVARSLAARAADGLPERLDRQTVYRIEKMLTPVQHGTSRP